MESYKPAIVVTAFNRGASLKRILKSIGNAHYPSRDIPLIISIDKSDKPEVAQVAKNFEWKYGEKTVLEQTENLGLRRHILKCGNLSEQYDSIILLEDDLYVSPHFYRYAQHALETYGSEPKIAGISLYSHHYNETSFMRFTPIQDEQDVYFMQIPSSWGQAWTKKQWADFRDWYAKNSGTKITSTAEVPPNVVQWPETSWKKYYFKYVIEKDLYFVYPYISLSTNFADIGTHHVDNRTTLQEPLQQFAIQYRFPKFEDAKTVYDSYCELSEKSFKRICPELAKYEFEVDLYGQKDAHQSKKPYFLTSKKILSPALKSFGRQFKPHEMNIVFDNPGSILHLADRKSVVNVEEIELIDVNRNSYYYDIAEHFLLKSEDEVRSEDRVASDAKVMSGYHEYVALQKNPLFKILRFFSNFEKKGKAR